MKGTGPTSGAALHKACRNGQTGIVESQLDQDTDIHSRDARDSTPLHSAAYAGQEEVVQILLERGANLGSLDKDKRTPLHRAIQEAHENVVRVLLAAGPFGLEFQDVYGLTPLHLAVRVATWEGEKMLNIITALLSAGASLDTTTFSGMCPTYEAMEFGAEAVANMLRAERDPHHEPLHTPEGDLGLFAGIKRAVSSTLSKLLWGQKDEPQGWKAAIDLYNSIYGPSTTAATTVAPPQPGCKIRNRPPKPVTYGPCVSCQFDYGAAVYSFFRHYLRHQLDDILAACRQRSDPELVDFFPAMWAKYSKMCKVVSTAFRYVDRHWVEYTVAQGCKGVRKFKDTALFMWSEHVFDHLGPRLISTALEVIDMHRDHQLDRMKIGSGHALEFDLTSKKSQKMFKPFFEAFCCLPPELLATQNSLSYQTRLFGLFMIDTDAYYAHVYRVICKRMENSNRRGASRLFRGRDIGDAEYEYLYFAQLLIAEEMEWLHSYEEFFERAQELTVASWFMNLVVNNKALMRNKGFDAREKLAEFSEINVSGNIVKVVEIFMHHERNDDELLPVLTKLRRSVQYDVLPKYMADEPWPFKDM